MWKLTKKKKKKQALVDFAVVADQRMKIKETEKRILREN